MNQAQYDKKKKELEELEAMNEKNLEEQRNIAYTLGGYRENIIKLVARSQALTDLILHRDLKVETLNKKLEKFKP